jgi:hypothetical protein
MCPSLNHSPWPGEWRTLGLESCATGDGLLISDEEEKGSGKMDPTDIL